MSEDPEVLFDRGNDQLAAGRAEEALALYEEARHQRPDRPELLANIGVAHAELGQFVEAIRWYDGSLRLAPDYPEAHYNRGNALRELRRYAEAVESYSNALRANATFPAAWRNRGLALMRLGRAADAVACYRQALQILPGDAETTNSLGLALQALGYVEDAIDHFSETIRQVPDHIAAHTNRAQAYLLKGDFRRGWPEYEWRRRLPSQLAAPSSVPAWDGSPLDGRTILLRAEQGMGDTIQFIRYAALIAERGGRVVLRCRKKLHRLLANVKGVERFIDSRAPAAGCDCYAPLLSLPGLFQSDFRSIPSRVPYLAAEADRVVRWQAHLPKDGTRIGICWKGNSDYPEDGFRSIPLAAFSPLAGLPGAQLVSLQLGEGVEQIPAFREKHELHELPSDLDAEGAFVDTAAVIMNLDLVVTCDTSIGHLAGALGRPVWLALPLTPEWRWFRDRDDTPWYPRTRLFRQQTAGDWASVFARMPKKLDPD